MTCCAQRVRMRMRMRVRGSVRARLRVPIPAPARSRLAAHRARRSFGTEEYAKHITRSDKARRAAVACPSGQSALVRTSGHSAAAALPFLATGASATGTNGTPSELRTLFSISMASAGFSFRNSRQLSLPWPIFSPL